VSDGAASFGVLLRQLRTAASLSQEELAECAGLSVRGISDLERGLRQAPRLETVRLLADGLALSDTDRAALLAAARPALLGRDGAGPSLLPGPVSLPTPLTRLIGRDSEVQTLRSTLERDEARLVTLTGVGGTGKTRLAIDVAARMLADFPDGVYFVDLSPLTDPDLVIPSIAAVLEVREVTGQPLIKTLSTFLAPKRLLLVLDNCERVLAAATDIVTLLTVSPDLTVLATSREPLRVRGEREFPLLPLQLPASHRLPAIEELAQVPAVALFLELASASQPDFSLTADNASAVTAICWRLDGLPLAIELAAARIKVLPPAPLLARLERRLPLLTGGGRDLPARQRTMRDAIAWSYDLLTPQEQALFRRLAVFAGGFTLEAAETVAAPDEDLALLDGVVALVEQSLLRQMPGRENEARYQMLETVREFGLEQLEAAGESDAVRQRHARHFLGSSDSLELGIYIRESPERLARDLADHDNVRLALSWFDESGETDELLQLCATAFGVWFATGLYREGLQWIERALERSRSTVSVARVQVLDAAGALAGFQGDYARAAALSDEELALARELGYPRLLGEALTQVGFLRYRQGEYEQAEALLDEAQRLLRGLAGAQPDAAAGAGIPLLILGDTAVAQGQFDRAAARYEDALEFFRPSGWVYGPIDARTGLGAVSYGTGDLVRAAALYWDSLERARTLGFEVILVSTLLGLAAVAADSGSPEEGAHLLGAAEAVAASLGAPIFPRDKPVRARALAALTVVLGPERLAAAREAGRALTVEDAIGEAKAVAEKSTSSPSELVPAPQDHPMRTHAPSTGL
jgi:predicted ATPase/DNA-binding XRE family transcriptional regulator